jgi:predicted protein tyrosine phosphatase
MARRPASIILPEEPTKVLSEREWLEAIARYQDTTDFAPEHKEYFKTHIMPIIKNRRFGEATKAAEIVEGIWLGEASDAMDIDTLKKHGVDSVINCAEKHTLTCAEYYPNGWRYLGLDCDDTASYDIIGKHLNEFTDFMDECVVNNHKVLVHCVAGINRSATLLIAYLVRRRGMSLIDAISLCHAKRPIILTNEAFVMSLIEWSERLEKKRVEQYGRF